MDLIMRSGNILYNDALRRVYEGLIRKEFTSPGSVPENATDILATLSPELLQGFRRICSMNIEVMYYDIQGDTWKSEPELLVPFMSEYAYCNDQKVDFKLIRELEEKGVIEFCADDEYFLGHISSPKVVLNINEHIYPVGSRMVDVPLGNIRLTNVGQVLFEMVTKKKLEGYEKLVVGYMRKNGIMME